RGLNLFTGSIGVGLFSGSTLIQTVKSFNTSNLKSFFGWNTYNFTSATIPSGVSNGNYKLYLMYKTATEANWTIIRGKIGTPNYLNVTVASNHIKIKTPTDALPKLNLNSFNKTGNLYQNKTGRFTANISNTGKEFNSKIAIYLQSIDNSSVNQFITTDPENIAAGETKEMSFNGMVTLAPGQYNLSFMYDPGNNPSNTISWSQLGEKVNVEVLAAPTGTPSLSLVSTIAFPDPLKVYKSNATINATITNTGGYFENLLIAFIFPKTSGSSLGYIGRQTAILDQNESRTISFTGGLSLDPNEYRIGIYYWDINSPNSNKWTRMTPNDFSLIPFNLKEDLTAFDTNNYEGGILFPNPAMDVIYLKPEKNITRIKIIDIFGKQIKSLSSEKSGIITIDISDLPKGAYLISSQSDSNITINKFIKK
ncbi:MAG TPA: CARDB domain-containing protein, partial [Paludibacter sp.]|nr:CARDB domain-containing protein [Paludibacter sp.]